MTIVNAAVNAKRSFRTTHRSRMMHPVPLRLVGLRIMDDARIFSRVDSSLQAITRGKGSSIAPAVPARPLSAWCASGDLEIYSWQVPTY
jgi:hypothetical protein